MDRTTLITAAATAIVGAALIALQSGRNKSLAAQIETETHAVERLEERSRNPGAGAGVSALNPGAPAPGSIEAAIAEARANSTPEERIAKAVEQIEAVVAELDDIDESPVAFFKALPDLMRLIQDLDLDEMIAVADRIDAPLTMSSSDGKSAMKMVIMMLAAEQDPVRVLANPGIAESDELRGMVLSSLVRKDPAAAREWLAKADLPDDKREEVEQMMIYQTLRTDFTGGLAMLRETDNPEESMQMLSMMSQFGLPEGVNSQIVAAIDDPANIELKPQLIELTMTATIAEGGVPAARERVEELGMSDEDVSDYVTENLSRLVRNEPGPALDWLAEVQTEEEFAETLPNAVGRWASQDFNAAGEWLGTMEPSPVRDATIAEYSRRIIEVDPKAAAIWAVQIEDETQRDESVRRAANDWLTEDPDAANDWLGENGYDSATFN